MFDWSKKYSVHSLVTGMRVNRGTRYRLSEISGYIFLSAADCGRYGEVIWGDRCVYYWPLPYRELAAVGRFQ